MPNVLAMLFQLIKLMMCSIHRVQVLSIYRAIWLCLLFVPATSVFALTIPATKDLPCAGDRYGGGEDLNCTAGEFTTSATFSAEPGTPPFCVAGQDFNFQVQLDLSGSNADRQDMAFFVGQSGNDPQVYNPTQQCSVATFPNTPTPFENNDGDTCGDYNAAGVSTTTINEIKVQCQGNVTGALAIPYTLTYWQNNGNVCTGPLNVTVANKSKCNANSAATVSGTVAVNVGTYIDVTKQTNPDGNSQTFTYTATGPAGSKVIALTGATLTPTSASGGTYSPATISAATNVATVSISDGQTVRFYMTG